MPPNPVTLLPAGAALSPAKAANGSAKQLSNSRMHAVAPVSRNDAPTLAEEGTGFGLGPYRPGPLLPNPAMPPAPSLSIWWTDTASLIRRAASSAISACLMASCSASFGVP